MYDQEAERALHDGPLGEHVVAVLIAHDAVCEQVGRVKKAACGDQRANERTRRARDHIRGRHEPTVPLSIWNPMSVS